MSKVYLMTASERVAAARRAGCFLASLVLAAIKNASRHYIFLGGM